jgi:hypothetical protein
MFFNITVCEQVWTPHGSDSWAIAGAKSHSTKHTAKYLWKDITKVNSDIGRYCRQSVLTILQKHMSITSWCQNTEGWEFLGNFCMRKYGCKHMCCYYSNWSYSREVIAPLPVRRNSMCTVFLLFTSLWEVKGTQLFEDQGCLWCAISLVNGH